MNDKQKTFFNKVILPKLVEMAIDGTLPSDITQLSHEDFQSEAEEFNNDNYEDERIERAGHYLCESDDITIGEQLKLIDTQSEIDETIFIDYIDGIIVWENVEFSFTVSQFLELID